MRRGPDFNQVLQERLDACPVTEPTPAHAPFPASPSLGFFFNHPGLAAPVDPTATSRRWQAPPPRQRPKRTLMPHEQRALDYLVGLGANIGSDFTEPELRSAFRALAREFHPDRHPGSTQQQKERLTAMFRRLRQAYEHLQGATSMQ